MKHKTQNGFSITEMLIASALGLILLAIVTSSYWLAKRNYLLEQAESTIQANASLAISLLQQQLRMAGFIGCPNVNDLQAKFSSSHTILTPENSIKGYQGNANNWQPALPTCLDNKVKPASDVITVWEREPHAYLASTVDEKIKIKSAGFPFDCDDKVLISSCKQAELLQVKSDSKELQEQPHEKYKEAEIARVFYFAYFIRPSNHISASGRPIYGLFRKSLWQCGLHAQELVEGIENMKISYGVQSSKQKEFVFVPAGQVHNWQEVKLVKLALLVTSVDDVLDKPQDYQFAGEIYKAHDRILRQEWITYLALRER